MLFDVTVYPETAWRELEAQTPRELITVAPLWRNVDSMMWTHDIGMEVQAAAPRLIINTKAWRHVYTHPKLVWMTHFGMLFSAFDDGPSGTVNRVKQVYILLEEPCRHRN